MGNGLISKIKELLVKYKSFIRFAIVGVINTLVTIIVNTICNNVFNIHHNVSWVIAYAAGVTNSYIMNKLWTFESKGGSKEKATTELLQFIVVNLVSLAGTTLGLNYLIENVGMDTNLAQFPTIVISQFINYFGYKLWVFKK
ncbi:GtrA family protein [Acetivibrio cellulolyticus]|uniref:GtrA family protein n=1 Tax=Acetivibrio cellulolyticus TaxID=35830 RepID=UPI0001E2EB5A|nr:GtrA family protein [Acetivibrio cellulolyticus]